MTHTVKILEKQPLNHNVIRFVLEKPSGFTFNAGQAIELSLPDGEHAGEPAPFTLTGLATDVHLELMIKIYAERNGITAALSRKRPAEKLVISGAWDSYIDKGPGVFLAGGAGVTPFVALLRQFKMNGNVGSSTLLFSNKTRADIFNESEFRSILGDRFINILTEKNEPGFPTALSEELLRSVAPDLSLPFYVCGPPGYIDHVNGLLSSVGVTEGSVVISL